MPTDEFVMRGQTANAASEVLNFGSKHGYAYRLTEFKVWGSTNLGDSDCEIYAIITAGKTALDPFNPNFNDEGLIGVVSWQDGAPDYHGPYTDSIINDTFLITQNLIITVKQFNSNSVNWQCRFKPVKLTETEMANANLRQFHVFDE